MSFDSDLARRLIAVRHDPESATRVLREYVQECVSSREFAEELTLSVLSLVHVLGELSKLDAANDRMLDAAVQNEDIDLLAHSMRQVDPETSMSTAYARTIFDELTNGTDPDARHWEIVEVSEDQLGVALLGDGVGQKRVYVPVGEDRVEVERFTDLMRSFEIEDRLTADGA